MDEKSLTKLWVLETLRKIGIKRCIATREKNLGCYNPTNIMNRRGFLLLALATVVLAISSFLFSSVISLPQLIPGQEQNQEQSQQRHLRSTGNTVWDVQVPIIHVEATIEATNLLDPPNMSSKDQDER